MSRTDGSVVINIIADDKEAQKVLGTLKDIENASKGMGKGTGNPFKDMPDGADKANFSIKNLTTSILASNVAMKALNVVTESFGAAMGRFDTMKRFPKMMEQMGFSSEQSERSIRKLSKGIEGLPTRLDEVVATTQGLASMTGDLNRATDLTLALNNAFLASESTAMDAGRGLQQFQQMLASGKVDMQSWKTLQETMPIGLQKTAEAFGFAGESAKKDFYQALKDGKITFSQFGDKLIELNKEVGGFADLALAGSEGIATSFSNIRTAVVNGLAGIIIKLDEVFERATRKNIAQNLDMLKGVVKAVFKAINDALEAVSPIIEGVIKLFVFILDTAVKLAPALEALAVGFLAFMALKKVSAVLSIFKGGLETIAIQALYAQDALKKMMTFIAANKWIVIAAAVAAVGYAIYKWLTKVPEDVEEFANKVKESTKEIQTLSDSLKESEENFETQKRTIQANSDAMKKAGERAVELASTQKRTAGETTELKDAISELNGYFGENTVQIDENTGKLNLNKEAMDAYFKVAEKEKELETTKARMNELTKQDNELKEKKLANEKALAEAQEKVSTLDEYEYGAKRKLRESIIELKEQKEKLSASEQTISAQLETVTARQKTLYDEVGQASEVLASKMEEHAQRRIMSLDELSEFEKTTAQDLTRAYNTIRDAATDMFDKINTDSKISHEEMIANLEHNIKAVDNWATNLEALADKGVNQGILDKLRGMGPQGAAYVAELINASDAELQKLNGLFEDAGKKAPENFSKSMGVNKESVRNGVYDLITETNNGLSEQIEVLGWDAHGEKIVDGVNQGINNGMPSSKTKAGELAQFVRTGFSSPLGIDTGKMSSVFQSFGTGVVGGLVSGMQNNQASAEAKSRSVANGISNAANNELKKAESGANYAGKMMGAGFVVGLEAKRASVVAKAESIAAAAGVAMSAALQINSPSKVTTEIGEFTGEGLEVGMESRLSAIKQIARKLSDAAIPDINQTEAGRITNNNNGNMVNNNSSNVNIEHIEWKGKEDIRKTMDEIGWITGQESWRLQEV